MSKLILAGSTGAVGQQVLQQALDHPDVSQVVCLLRSPRRSALAHPKLVDVVLNLQQIPQQADWWTGAHALICTLGTTIKIAKTPEAFREVDLHLPARLATAAAANGVRCFVLNSSTMANAKASGLYLRTKGEAEAAVQAAGFKSVIIARPGLLDARREENRLGEEIGLMFSRLANPLLPKRWRSVKVANLARVMLKAALEAKAGVHVLESEQFQS